MDLINIQQRYLKVVCPNNSVNAGCPKLRRFAMHLWAAGYACRWAIRRDLLIHRKS